jgi:hypothetical protein
LCDAVPRTENGIVQRRGNGNCQSIKCSGHNDAQGVSQGREISVVQRCNKMIKMTELLLSMFCFNYNKL